MGLLIGINERQASIKCDKKSLNSTITSWGGWAAFQGFVALHYVCATRGEAGEVDAALLRGYRNLADWRAEKLFRGAQLLGLRGLHFLKDRSIQGWPART